MCNPIRNRELVTLNNTETLSAIQSNIKKVNKMDPRLRSNRRISVESNSCIISSLFDELFVELPVTCIVFIVLCSYQFLIQYK